MSNVMESLQTLRSAIKLKKESENNIYMKKSIEDLRAASLNGGESMDWKSPWNPGYIFHISRRDNNVEIGDGTDSQYIIEILILDSFYTKICLLSLTELTADILLDNIDYYLSNTTDNANINFPFLQRIDSSLPFMEINRIPIEITNKDDPYYDKKNDQIRNNKLSINLYSPEYQYMTHVVTIYLSAEELCDFAYAIFFVGLIDIDDVTLKDNGANDGLDKVVSDLFLNKRK